MSSGSYTSRFEKELQLGLSIKSQVEEGVPKGTLRAISIVWLKKYLDYIALLASASND
jgi:hypothetical protein